MSSEDDQPGALPSPAKKRRVQRACDMCRRKKRACDGLRMSGKKCTNCTDSGLECTFAGTVAKRRSYVEALESRLEMTEQLLRKLTPQKKDKAVSPLSPESPNNTNGNAWSADSPVLRHGELAVTPSGGGETGPGVLIAALNLRSMNLPAPVPHGDDLAHIALLEDFSNLSITQARHRFQGKSSGAMLVKAAVQLREGYEEKDIPWSSRRSHYWSFNPVKYRLPHTGPFLFPPPDLLASLVSLYFTHKNLYFPVLHRPTFARLLASGLHLRDSAFGAVVLLVCAIGSRFSSDARVSRSGAKKGEEGKEGKEGGEGKGEELRCGWEFFDQLPWMLDHLFERPSVFHLQYYCLATSFLEFSAPASCWTLIGIGIRLAQDLGVHRQRDPGTPKSAEGELWKRGFWVLVSYDRMVSMVLGRSCATQFEDIDADLPIECDDEYWPDEVEGDFDSSDSVPPANGSSSTGDSPITPTADNTNTNGANMNGANATNGNNTNTTNGSDTANKNGNTKQKREAWTQPSGKPSRIAFFNAFLRLNNILAFGLKMLYALNKTKMLLAHRDAQWEEHLVAELDSALNGWVDSIPAHLRWDPNRRDEAFFDQSALLYCNYYQVQISIHRPFIPAISGGAPTALPSLAICTNAARSCSHIADISRIRRDGVPVPVLISSVFTSGVILLLNVWSGKRTGLPPHLNSAITEVHKCMKAIRVCEKRWQTAGLYYDLLSELATIGQVPLPKEPSRPTPSAATGTNNTQSQKRAREEDDVGRYGAAMPVQHPPYANAFQPAPSTSQSQTAQPFYPAGETAWEFAVAASLGLPMYGGDLGRLPVFHQNAESNSRSAASTSGWQGAAPLGFPDFTVPVGVDTTDSMANAFNAFGADGLGVFGAAESNGTSNGFALGVGVGGGADGMGSDTMAMWANAPMGFEVDDWGTYFSVMNEMNLNVGADSQGSG